MGITYDLVTCNCVTHHVLCVIKCIIKIHYHRKKNSTLLSLVLRYSVQREIAFCNHQRDHVTSKTICYLAEYEYSIEMSIEKESFL